MTVKEIPTCCVTGAIAGDGGACGDCDPCIMGEASVPASVKRLIAEKNSLLNQLGELQGKLDDTLEVVSAMESFIGVMFGIGPDATIPETVNAPIGVPIKVGDLMRSASKIVAQVKAA